MLNLNNPIAYTRDEQQVISDVMATHASGKDRWNDTKMKPIKHRISVSCLTEQECCCAFCEGILKEGDAPIEHITPKGRTPDFVFEPDNLVVSCTSCNSPSIKGENPTIQGAVNPVYRDNNFIIVHPRIDNPDQHIRFLDADRTTFDWNNCSPKGQFTINFFHWNNLNAYRNRVASAAVKKLPFDIAQMVNEISTYKP